MGGLGKLLAVAGAALAAVTFIASTVFASSSRPTPTVQVPKTGIPATHDVGAIAPGEDRGIYSTHPDDAELDTSGKVSTSVGTVTALPLRDRKTGLFARLTYHDALTAAARLGGQLLSESEQDAIAKEGTILDPVILPPTSSMGSLAWARREDAGIQTQLSAKGWDGSSPVTNAGKDWIRGAAAGKAINRGWYVNAAGAGTPPPAGHLIQTTGGAHNDAHTDYSQLTRLIFSEAA